jgi:hypothetical protein
VTHTKQNSVTVNNKFNEFTRKRKMRKVLGGLILSATLSLVAFAGTANASQQQGPNLGGSTTTQSSLFQGGNLNKGSFGNLQENLGNATANTTQSGLQQDLLKKNNRSVMLGGGNSGIFQVGPSVGNSTLYQSNTSTLGNVNKSSAEIIQSSVGGSLSNTTNLGINQGASVKKNSGLSIGGSSSTFQGGSTVGTASTMQSNFVGLGNISNSSIIIRQGNNGNSTSNTHGVGIGTNLSIKNNSSIGAVMP